MLLVKINSIFCRAIAATQLPMLYPKPTLPYSTANSSRSSHGGTVPSSSRSLPTAGTSSHVDNDAGSRQNPLTAFDSRDVSLITVVSVRC